MKIEITSEKIKKIKQYLTLEEFFYLWEKANKVDNTVLLCDTVNLAVKGYLYSGSWELTPKAKGLIKEIEKSDTFTKEVANDYSKIHKTLQDKLLSLYGKKQKEGFGGVYFIPTVKELEEFMNRFFKKYPKYNDMAKITKILESHIEKCVKTGKFSPAIKYYIGKSTNDGYVSQLAAAYDSYEEKKKEEEDKPIQVINTKDLF